MKIKELKRLLRSKQRALTVYESMMAINGRVTLHPGDAGGMGGGNTHLPTGDGAAHVCNYCSKAFASVSYLRKHKARRHAEEEENLNAMRAASEAFTPSTATMTSMTTPPTNVPGAGAGGMSSQLPLLMQMMQATAAMKDAKATKASETETKFMLDALKESQDKVFAKL